jgi:hypothetical protein
MKGSSANTRKAIINTKADADLSHSLHPEERRLGATELKYFVDALADRDSAGRTASMASLTVK